MRCLDVALATGAGTWSTTRGLGAEGAAGWEAAAMEPKPGDLGGRQQDEEVGEEEGEEEVGVTRTAAVRTV